MGNGQHETGSRYVRTLFNAGTVGGLTDEQLLEWFRTQRGETAELAFATLVQRHGPMVLRVCRSLLRDQDDAHDAFQATFLVLVRRSGSLWVRESLGPWLYQVAYRVASSARSAASRRRRHERRAAELAGPGVHEVEHDDVGAVLHDEVNRLPWGCRSAVVLCYFDGLSPEQAARQLGCPVGTVQSRLARGRERLRSRLTRRGLAPALVALGAENAGAASSASPPAALVEATVQAALPQSAATGVASGSVIRLTQGVLQSMLLIKLRTIAIGLITIAVLAAGARSFMQEAPAAPRPTPNLEQIRSELGARNAGAADRREPPAETGPPPADLAWNDIPAGDRLQIIEQLAAQSRGNYEKIRTWQGSYSYVLRQYVNEQFVAQLLAGAQPRAGQPAPQGKSEGLLQEFDSTLTFAIDRTGSAIYRDVETSRMRFLRIGTDVEVKIGNVGPDDHRSIVTPESYLVFRPKDRATTAFLPDHPDAQMKRRAERFALAEARMREGGTIDPRDFFKFDPGNSFWTGLEHYARAFRGELGAAQKTVVEERFKLGKADGPGGRWYRDEMGFGNPGGSMLWVSTLWSPEAGYNPVSTTTTLGTPDGKPQSRIDWQWKLIDGIYVPSTIKESVHRAPGNGLSKEQVARLKGCEINRPLGAHQFDERGLGLEDGDLVLDHLTRVAHIIKGGEPVKLANFGERSILKVNAPRAQPAPAPATPAQTLPRPAGRIYTTASLRTDARGLPIRSVVAVDPESGDVTNVFDGAPGRLRVSPDGRNAAYVWNEPSMNLPPVERMRQSVWVRPLAGGSEPRRILRLDGEGGGAVPVWSRDGKQLIVSVGRRDEAKQRWVFETSRMNADGSGRQSLNIPPEDSVQDWSSDGAWLLIASQRNARIGWQLYVMRPDGTDQRQVTEGGNPFYARFAPDGRSLLHSDGTRKLVDRQGIWIVDVDGKNRRRLFATDGNAKASACWSPDGQRIAVALGSFNDNDHARLEIVNLDGTHRTLLTFPGADVADMPDWR